MSDEGTQNQPGGTVAVQIDENSRTLPTRHSWQPSARSGTENAQVKRHSSVSVPRKHSLGHARKPAIPVIPETEISEDDVLGQQNTVGNTGAGGSFLKNSQIRKMSNISRASSRSQCGNGIMSNGEKGILNHGFDQTSRSSMHGSMSSLPVIREQYCCCQRWTRLERYLAIVVATLALVIIALVIAVGCLAGGRGHDISFPYTLAKF